MPELVHLVNQIESSDKQVVFHFKVETADHEVAHLYVWEESSVTSVNWEIGGWYKLHGVQRKEFDETIEFQVMAETKIERIQSKQEMNQLGGTEHFSDPSSNSRSAIESECTTEETLSWLQNDSEYSKQIKHTESISAKDPRTTYIEIPSQVQNALEGLGIDELYNHQKRALDAARNGSNLVLSSNTASGKSIPYQIYTLEKAIRSNSTALYIAPQRSLINDQAETFEQLIDQMDLKFPPQAAIYHGDIPRWEKKRIRRSKPNIILMTPEQVQLSLLPLHDSIWTWFFKRLNTIVIDEIHEFRGIFGSHISQICRRINRLTSHYDSNLQYFCCSATIGNPKEHASNITDKPANDFIGIEKDTSGSGARHWLLYNPPYKQDSSADPPGPEYPDDWGEIRKEVLARDKYTCTKCGLRGGQIAPVTLHIDHIIPVGKGGSHSKANLRTLCASCHDDRAGHSVSDKKPDSVRTVQEVKQERERLSNQTTALNLFIELVRRGNQVVVFGKTRQGAERYSEAAISELREHTNDKITDSIKPYHSHLPNDDRVEIEAGLQSGEVRGVWSTSALEIGVDIGGLDAVILSGHPGTTMELFQRAGRAGRGLDDCLILFVASGNPLDQYFIGHPEHVFDESPGNAAISPDNPQILADHIPCAAKEFPIEEEDPGYPVTEYETFMTTLEQQGTLSQRQDGDNQIWQCEISEPHHSVSLRGISDWNFALINKSSGTEIGDTTPSLREALRDCHPGAIYILNGQKYQVTQFDQDKQQIYLREYNGSEYTQAYSEEEITVRKTVEERCPEQLQNINIGLAEVTYETNINQYLLKEHYEDNDPEKKDINQDLPTFELNTEALYLTVPDNVRRRASNITKVDHPFLGALHGVEHLLMSLFSLETLCEQQNIGGLSQTYHPETNQGTIFLYDDVPGGVGISHEAFNRIETLIRGAYNLVSNCECEHGCPHCIHSPRCQNGNRALHKDLTIHTLEWITTAETR